MSERIDALKLAEQLLNRVNADPDDDLGTLSRQLMRATERSDKLREAIKDHCFHPIRPGTRDECMYCTVLAETE